MNTIVEKKMTNFRLRNFTLTQIQKKCHEKLIRILAFP